jgi:hypothetical protein
MKFARLAALMSAIAALTIPATAIEAKLEAMLDGYKVGKLLPIHEVAALMRSSERWCYNEEAGICDWSDIYLEVGADGATFDLMDMWTQDIEITLTEKGVFRDGQFICETGEEYTQSLRARNAESGEALAGRELFALKTEIAAAYAANASSDDLCFDYLFGAVSPAADTVTVTQRIWRAGETDPAEDARVTLHFDKEAAEALSVRW